MQTVPSWVFKPKQNHFFGAIDNAPSNIIRTTAINVSRVLITLRGKKVLLMMVIFHDLLMFFNNDPQ